MVETKKEVDKVSWWGVVIGSVIWLISVAWFGITFRSLPPVLPLFYSLPVGEQQLVEKFWFLLILVIAGVLFGGNLLLANWLGKEEVLIRRFLIWGGMVALLLLLMTEARILLIIR